MVKWEGDTQECLKAGKPASLLYTEELRDSKPNKEENKNNTQACLLTPTHAQCHMHTLTNMHVHARAHKHTHAHTQEWGGMEEERDRQTDTEIQSSRPPKILSLNMTYNSQVT